MKGAVLRTAPFILSDSQEEQQESRSMMDIVLLATAIIFFALCLAYTKACDRL
jgi:hypothetical protein